MGLADAVVGIGDLVHFLLEVRGDETPSKFSELSGCVRGSLEVIAHGRTQL